MGIAFSCPFSACITKESDLEEILVKSIYFANEEAKTLVRSVVFSDQCSQPVIMRSAGSGNSMALEASVSLGTLKPEKVESPISVELPVSDPFSPKHEAAIKLQKVYKSFRTRRKLADCAVLVQQKWEDSVSLFDKSKHETAVSRWWRARTLAAKVGKGLSKNSKAQQLALQHWLEAIDPRHRYGHNLHLYYNQWLHCQSRQPFFYWLDVGEGKEVNLVDKCPRSKLQEQCIKYLGPVERKAFEVTPEGGKLFYKETGEPLHTLEEPGDVKWIFVLSTSKTMYIGIKKKGSFQHSSFLAGGAALAAGRLVVERGTLKAVWPHSGHYRPTAENFRDFVTFLQENGVDLTDVKLSPVEEESSSDGSSVFLRSNSSAEDLTASDSEESAVENTPEDGGDADERKTASPQKGSPKQISRIQSLGEKLANLEVPTRSDFLGWFESCDHETADKAIEEPSQESSSLQVVGKQPCSEWTTGAGPRIKYVRGYPPELQVQALEQVSLSPRRSSCLSRSLQSGTWHSPVKLLTESSSSELVKRE